VVARHAGVRQLAEKAARILHSPWLWLGVIAVALAWPASDTWGFPFLSNPREARDYLQVAWQVQAAAVGFSLSVAVFALQAASGDKWRPSTRELARVSWADVVLALGVTSIIVNGLVLAGVGRGAPGGWAGSVAVAVGALSLGFLLPLWISSVRLIAGGELRQLRLRQLAADVHRSVDRQVTERIGLALLERYLAELKIRFDPLEFDHVGLRAVAAARIGEVRDVRVRRLNRLRRDDAAPATVRAYLGLHCGVETTIAWVEPARRDLTAIRRCFRLRREADGSLSEGFGLLHSIAIRSIDDGDALAYAEIRRGYIQTLQSYPQAWARFGRRFDSDAAQQLHPFALPVLHQVQDNLLQQILHAVHAGRQDLVPDAIWLPASVALDASAVAAQSLASAMLDVLVWAHGSLETASADPKSAAAADRIRRAILEYADYGPEHRLETESLPVDERVAAAGLVRDAFARVCTVARRLLDLGRTAELTQLLTKWNDVGRHFDPDPEPVRLHLDIHPQMDEVERGRLEVELRNLEMLRTAGAELQSVRLRMFFDLFVWTVYQVGRGSATTPAVTMSVLSRLPSSVDELLDLLPEPPEFGGRLLEWVMTSRPESSGFGAIGVDEEVMTAFGIAAIRATTAGKKPVLRPSRLVAEKESELLSAVDRAADSWPYWSDVFPDGDERARANALKEGLRDSASLFRLERRRQIIDEPPDRGFVQEFEQAVRDGFRDARLLSGFLTREPEVVRRSDDLTPTFLGGDRFLEKEWFRADRVIGALDHVAHDIGADLAEAEMTLFVDKVFALHAEPTVDRTLRDRIVDAVSRLRNRGFDPRLVLVSTRLRVDRDLGLGRRSISESGVETWRVGTIEGVDVYNWPGIPEESAVVLDPDRAINWCETEVERDGESLVVSLHTLERGAMEARAKCDPTFFAAEDRTSVDGRAEEALTKVALRVWLATVIDVRDPQAASVISTDAGPAGEAT
jgi:hypothetical protein